MSKSLTRDVKEAALKLGADLVGIASVDRFFDAPPEHDPKRALPETRTLISVAIRHLRGVQFTQKRLRDNYPYQIFGYGWLSHIRINTLLFELARVLEDRGYIALPYPSFCDADPTKGHEDPKPAASPAMATVSNRHAAVAAGIAQFGLCNLAMTEEFGTCQRFGTIMTSAPLEPDPMIAKPLCNNCGKCVEACPSRAIGSEPEVSFQIGDQTINIAALKRPRCYWYHFGLSKKTYGVLDIDEPEEITREIFEQNLCDALAKSRYMRDRYQKTFAPAGYCGMCLLSCPMGKYKLK
ncbi:MAG: epoxyqueuosine reductase [Pirellulales bacterium]|nr:epoxyqueuosine reductase [Pirellulales bacterium]